MLSHFVAEVALRRKRRFSVSVHQTYSENVRDALGCDGYLLLGGTSPDYGKRCLSVSAGVDMLEAWRGVGASATR